LTKLTDDTVAVLRAEMRAVNAVRQQQVAAARGDALAMKTRYWKVS
jgi:hypothetical protein